MNHKNKWFIHEGLRFGYVERRYPWRVVKKLEG